MFSLGHFQGKHLHMKMQ